MSRGVKRKVRIAIYASLLLLLGIGIEKVKAQASSRSVAIFQNQEDRNVALTAREYAARYMVQVAGMPFIETSDLVKAMEHKFILTTAKLSTRPNYFDYPITEEQLWKLQAYIKEGGIVISPNIRDPAVLDLFGLSGEEFGRNRYSLTFTKTRNSAIYNWIDEPHELTIMLGDSTYGNDGRAMNSRAYSVREAHIIARYGNGEPAITSRSLGSGFVYTIGLSWQDLIIRNMLNMDFTAERSYSNGFEPSTDVLSLLIRGIYVDHVKFPVWKHTSPLTSESTLIITHDVDAKSAMEIMNQYAAYEHSQGIQASYYITTHYIDDDIARDYYIPYRDSVTRLYDQNQMVGSHSVGHFPDFDELPFGSLGETMESYTPQYKSDSTQGGTILGELEVSKQLLEKDVPQEIKSFRAGHLLFPDKLSNALDTLDYKFDSSNSANAVLTSFPYRLFENQSFNGRITDVWEIPMTLSDVYSDEPISKDNYREKVDGWLAVLQKYKNNGAPVVLLIHPNRDFKLEAEKSFISQLPEDVMILPLKRYGNFWIDRKDLDFRTSVNDGVLTVQIAGPTALSDSLSFVTYQDSTLDEIHLLDNSGSPIAHSVSRGDNNKLFVHKANPATDINQVNRSVPHRLQLHPNYPNPFNNSTNLSFTLPRSSYVKLNIYSVTGRHIRTLLHRQLERGYHSLRFDAAGLSSGVYIYRINSKYDLQQGKMLLLK